MARKKKSGTPLSNTGSEPVPPGATKKAADRPRHRGGGAPGSGAGPRHAANDPGSPDEEYGAAETNQPLAEAPGAQGQGPATQPAEERGERYATGKAIARGGKTQGHVPGATEQQPAPRKELP
jgi:hypothetical protein